MRPGATSSCSPGSVRRIQKSTGGSEGRRTDDCDEGVDKECARNAEGPQGLRDQGKRRDPGGDGRDDEQEWRPKTDEPGQEATEGREEDRRGHRGSSGGDPLK